MVLSHPFSHLKKPQTLLYRRQPPQNATDPAAAGSAFRIWCHGRDRGELMGARRSLSPLFPLCGHGSAQYLLGFWWGRLGFVCAAVLGARAACLGHWITAGCGVGSVGVGLGAKEKGHPKVAPNYCCITKIRRRRSTNQKSGPRLTCLLHPQAG